MTIIKNYIQFTFLTTDNNTTYHLLWIQYCCRFLSLVSKTRTTKPIWKVASKIGMGRDWAPPPLPLSIINKVVLSGHCCLCIPYKMLLPPIHPLLAIEPRQQPSLSLSHSEFDYRLHYISQPRALNQSKPFHTDKKPYSRKIKFNYQEDTQTHWQKLSKHWTIDWKWFQLLWHGMVKTK